MGSDVLQKGKKNEQSEMIILDFIQNVSGGAAATFSFCINKAFHPSGHGALLPIIRANTRGPPVWKTARTPLCCHSHSYTQTRNDEHDLSTNCLNKHAPVSAQAP